MGDKILRHWRARGLGPLLDGFVFSGFPCGDTHFGYASIAKATHPDEVLYGRTLSVEMPPGGMLVHLSNLEPCDQPEVRLFATDNPYGKCLGEERISVGDLVLACALFEETVSATFYSTKPDERRTIRSFCLSRAEWEGLRRLISDALARGDVDDAVETIVSWRPSKENGEGR